MKQQKRQYTRAARLVWSHISQFSLPHYVGDHAVVSVEERWYSDYTPAPGALVALRACRPNEWCLSFVVEFQHQDRVLLRSLETEKLAWWGNVGFLRYGGKIDPQWLWTDRQHDFNDKWERVCYKDRDAYITLPIPASFGEGYSVTVGTRTRFALDDHRPTKTFDDWRKVTKAMLLEFYDEAVREHDQLKAVTNAHQT